MKNEIIMKIVEAALEIGKSSRHHVSIDINNGKGFPVIVYIHNEGYNEISDRREFSNDSSYEMHKKWLIGWKAIIETEREEDETYRY